MWKLLWLMVRYVYIIKYNYNITSHDLFEINNSSIINDVKKGKCTKMHGR